MTTVLLATDADTVFDEVDAALGDGETTVYRVRAGRDVPAACGQLEPDLVVLDLQIGNAGGVATSLYLRQDQEMGRLPRFPVLMLLDREADLFMAQLARADGWLIKPLDFRRLRRATNALLGGATFHEGLVESAG